MTEERLGFLCGLASRLSNENGSNQILRSYYLMRCNDLTNGYGLPMKQFSKRVRCPKCCLEWTRDTKVNIKSLRPNTKMNCQRNSRNKSNTLNKVYSKHKLILHNEMEQICQFCKNCSTTLLVKPAKAYMNTPQKVISGLEKDNAKEIINMKDKNSKKIPEVKKKEPKNSKVKSKQESVVNLYSSAFDVFSLKNEKNTLISSVKAPTKVIKNNKKRKDKFAGLCQKAVMATKQQVETQQQTVQNKLNLFLKPSN